MVLTPLIHSQMLDLQTCAIMYGQNIKLIGSCLRIQEIAQLQELSLATRASTKLPLTLYVYVCVYVFVRVHAHTHTRKHEFTYWFRAECWNMEHSCAFLWRSEGTTLVVHPQLPLTFYLAWGPLISLARHQGQANWP